MKPKVSVIVPVYNVAPYLEKCLASLNAQMLEEMEFIVVDDGSGDDSGKIAEKYISSHKRFRLIRQKNKGYAGARNAGLSLAEGKYLGFVDSDDWIEPDMFLKLFQLAEAEDADISGCSYWYEYQQDHVSIPFDNSIYVEILRKNHGRLLGGAESCLFDSAVSWNRIYRKEMFDRYRIHYAEQLEMAEDVPVFWESYVVARKIVLSSEPLYHYRNQREGQQVSFRDERLFSFFTLFDVFENFLNENGIKGLDPWIVHLKLSRFCYGYENILPELREKYFAGIRAALLKSGVNKRSCIASGSVLYGGAAERLRSLLLIFLHPVALKALLTGNRKAFERVVFFRKFLSDLPRKTGFLLNRKAKK